MNESPEKGVVDFKGKYLAEYRIKQMPENITPLLRKVVNSLFERLLTYAV